ncbi:MAG: InlB B-repeat-containing protein, partial [Erysipelotrichales bacterium]|nr:InlB B-repeat-containing protein [Erysipelotrichales bacterium]
MLVFHAPARISAAEEVTIPGTFHQTDARWLFDQTNELRVTPGISIKNSDGSEKYYNQAGSLYLEKYTYDYALVQIALQRDSELALYCSHTRPNGESYSSLSWNGVTSDGENIGWGTVGYADRDWVFTSWCETDKNYWSQSHRRNMLDEEFTAMGAACFEYKGYLYWVQEFGVAPSGAASVKALDGYGIRTIPYLEKYVSSSKFTGSETVTLNAMGGNVKTSSFTVDYGGTYPALEEPVKEGFRFDGWYTLDSGGDLIKKGSTVKIFGNHTLFAKWAYTLTSPELVSAVSTESGVKIQWNPVTGASRYRIYRKVSGGTWKSLGTSSKTTYTDKNALSGELCYYTVRCITESGESASGYRSPGLKITYYKTPDAPVLTYTSGGIKVNPEEVPGAVNYRIYRKEGNEDYRALADTNELLYIDKNVESGKEYSYTIAVLTADGKTELTGYRKIGATILYYNAPMIESVRLVKNTCEITWTLVPGIEYYRVYRRQGTGDWVSIGR